MQTPHLDHAYEDELNGLRTALERTGARAEQMVRESVAALLSRDASLARRVIANERDLDRLENELDRLCVTLLARRSPVGEDLRLVMCALKSDVDMERIGDLASHVAERAIEISGWAEHETLAEVVLLANGTVDQVSRAMSALASRDGVAARRVIKDDQDLDRLHKDILRRMIALGKDQPDQLDRTFAWSSISRNLERIADHACNIAEMVVFYAEGQVLRHGADGLE